MAGCEAALALAERGHDIVHRNTYLSFPGCLTEFGSSRKRPDLLFAGQLTGVEGYTESAVSGILAGVNQDRVLRGHSPSIPPPRTMVGGLFRYLRDANPARFQPMNSKWGLVDPLEAGPRKKTARRAALADRANQCMERWIADHGIMLSRTVAT